MKSFGKVLKHIILEYKGTPIIGGEYKYEDIKRDVAGSIQLARKNIEESKKDIMRWKFLLKENKFPKHLLPHTKTIVKTAISLLKLQSIIKNAIINKYDATPKVIADLLKNNYKKLPHEIINKHKEFVSVFEKKFNPRICIHILEEIDESLSKISEALDIVTESKSN